MTMILPELKTKKRAEELQKKIEQTNDLIDEMYGLTDKEIESVEEVVDG